MKDIEEKPGFKYLFRRFVSGLFYYRFYRLFCPDRPFYAPAAIKNIGRRLNKNLTVFEWGTGQSSVWYSKRVKEYIGVEYDETWFKKVTGELQKDQLGNARIIYSPPSRDAADFNWEGEWPHYPLLKHPPSRPEFRNYMSVIDGFPDHYFDCISVDGRERVGCVLHALPKLAQDGFLILDDSSRARYKEAFEILSGWKRLTFDFGLLQTSLFFRN
ncbi:MAG: hypothetical protein JW774_05710 [Candidatus Aureabacteria bacterium]|nr:hypothetical protein [Candidatus Auribacterota bacterium]